MNRNVMQIISTGFRGIFFSLTFIILLAACMDDDDDFVTEPVEVAYVSIYQASPDAPDIDITVDDRQINRNPFDYTSYSGYLNFYTGSRNFKFSPANANNVLVDTTFSFEDQKIYSLFVINRLSDIEALLVVDSTAAPAEGKAMIRFVHLSPDAPAFDVAVSGETDSTSFVNKSFKEATGFQEVKADTYDFQIKNAGGAEVVLTAEDIDIRPGRYYTIVTRGFANPPEGNTNVLSVEVLD